MLNGATPTTYLQRYLIAGARLLSTESWEGGCTAVLGDGTRQEMPPASFLRDRRPLGT